MAGANSEQPAGAERAAGKRQQPADSRVEENEEQRQGCVEGDQVSFKTSLNMVNFLGSTTGLH